MKLGDIVSREVVWEVGYVLLRNASSRESAGAFMKAEYPTLPYEVVQDEDNPNALCVKLISIHVYTEQAKVKWVVEDEAALVLGNGDYKIIEISKEPEWKVTYESAPSYQSSVAQMSEEELRASIDALRAGRLPVARKERVAREPAVDKNDPVAVALASMSPEKKQALMKKLGMVD